MRASRNSRCCLCQGRVEAFSDGVYWANHHYIFKLFEKTNHSLNLLNLLFLLCIAFPFQTLLPNEHLLDGANQATAATFHAFGLWLPAAAWPLMSLYATRWNHRSHLDPGYLRHMMLQYRGSVALCTIALLLSLADFQWGRGFASV